MTNLWFTADLHFGREEMIQKDYMPRYKKWDTVAQMDETIIDNWNKLIDKQDNVFILGDFSNYEDKEKNIRLWRRLNGKKVLILGNHDTPSRLDIRHFPIGSVCLPSCSTIYSGAWELFLTHYPVLDWKNQFIWNNNKATPNAIQLYGHVHDKKIPELDNLRAYNVSLDNNDLKPVSLEQILNKLKITG